MKNLMLIACVFLMAATSGCGTIYKAVVDERDVRTIASDTKIKLKIVNAFIDDEKIKALDIFTGVYEGRVYLVGQYESLKQKKLAVEIAKGVENVKSVTTHMLLKKKEEDPDCKTKKNLGIMLTARKNLIQDKDIWSTNVDVKSVQCNIVLVGLVGTKGEIEKVKAHAKRVEGVRSVTSYLRSMK